MHLILSLKLVLFQTVPGGPADLADFFEAGDYIVSINGIKTTYFERPDGIIDYLNATCDNAKLVVFNVSFFSAYHNKILYSKVQSSSFSLQGSLATRLLTGLTCAAIFGIAAMVICLIGFLFFEYVLRRRSEYFMSN